MGSGRGASVREKNITSLEAHVLLPPTLSRNAGMHVSSMLPVSRLKADHHCFQSPKCRERKLNTNFFSQTFRVPPGYPAKKVWFPWFRGTYRTFWPPPLHVEDPHPTGGYAEPKVWVWVPFSCLKMWVFPRNVIRIRADFRKPLYNAQGKEVSMYMYMYIHIHVCGEGEFARMFFSQLVNFNQVMQDNGRNNTQKPCKKNVLRYLLTSPRGYAQS